jgi:hypothetical protein
MQEDQMPTVARVGSYTLIQIIEIETITEAKDGISPKSEIQKFKSQKLSDYGGFQPPEVRKKQEVKITSYLLYFGLQCVAKT